METETDGWKEHKAKMAKKKKWYNKEMYHALKSRVYGKYVGFSYRKGQFEQIFGGKRESNEKSKS